MAKAKAEAGTKASGAATKPLEAALIVPGVLFLAAAIAGAAVKGAGFDLPAVNSIGRQLLSGLVGGFLIVVGLASRWWPIAAPVGKAVRDRLGRRFGPRPPGLNVGVPPDPSPHFVSRDDELRDLHDRLGRDRLVALIGLGGVGKTQLAAKYAELHGEEYSNGVFWLRGDRDATLLGDFVALTKIIPKLELSQTELADQELAIAAVGRWLREHQHWLLVVDNVAEEAVPTLERLLPRGLLGHRLFTSRHPLPWGDFPPLGPLPIEVATRFLLARTGQADEDAAREVARELGGLPLALEQAGAYMKATGEELDTYAQLIGPRLRELLALGRRPDHPTVITTWSLSFRRVEKASDAAADLLRLCAFMAPDDIPLRLLEAGASKLESPLAVALGDRLKLNRAIEVLLRYSLVIRRGDTLSVHRLVQAVVRDSLPADRRSDWAGAALRIMEDAFPAESLEVANWPVCQLFLPHVLAAADHAWDQKCEPLVASRLLRAVGQYLQMRAELEPAKTNLERALQIHQAAYGPDHPAGARSRAKL